MSLKYPKVYGYRLVEQIGGGGFSMVFRAVNVQNYRIAACKVVLLKPETTKSERKALNKEIQVHHSLKHPNVLDFVGAVIVEPDQDLKYIPGVYMLLELAAGGDLFDKIAPDIGIEEDLTHHYFSQLVEGMTYIHDQGVCHRDLKPENLLLDAAGTLKICDFGLCAVYKLKSTGKTRMLSDNCGSLPYVAPEVTKGEPFAAEPPDIWGCGVILFAMLSGNTPWDEPSLRSYEYTRYVSGKCFDDAPWARFSEDVLSLLTGMLALEPSERMTLANISQHPWVNRQSQIARDPVALAERLTESLRISGDLAIASQVPMDIDEDEDANENSDVDADGDQIMRSPKHTATQFTQSLLLFSQTQSGRRYTPHLTRFYTSLGPGIIMPLIQEALVTQGTKWKSAEHDKPGSFRLRIGGFDRRKLLYKGWIDLEPFNYAGFSGTFCLMRRDQGNPISWRQLWRAIIMCEAVEPHVLKKR